MKFKLINIKKESLDINNKREFDIDDESGNISTQELEIGNKIKQFLEELIDKAVSDNISEQFISNQCLIQHFRDHCLGKHTERKSTTTNVYYDFTGVNEYSQYENAVSKHVLDSPKVVASLYDIQLLSKYFRKLFEGNVSINFLLSCGLKNNVGDISIGLHSFATKYTDNYTKGNTIDLIVFTPNKKTISLYAVDAHYLQTKINNLLKTYYDSPNSEVPQYQFNND